MTKTVNNTFEHKKPSVREMVALNQAKGECWFAKDSIAFFDTKFVDTRGKYNLFVTSECGPNEVRQCSIRFFHPIKHTVYTLGDFNKMSLKEARALKMSLTKKLDQLNDSQLDEFFANAGSVSNDDLEGLIEEILESEVTV